MLGNKSKFVTVFILISLVLVSCERPIRRITTVETQADYATKSAIEVIEGKVFVPTRDIALVSDLAVTTVAKVAEVTEINTPEPTTTPEPTNTSEPTNTPEPTETPTLEPTETPEPEESDSENEEEVLTSTEEEVEESSNGFGQSEAEEEPTDNNESFGNNITPTAIINLISTPVAEPSALPTGAWPTATANPNVTPTPNWQATQNASTAGNATDGSTDDNNQVNNTANSGEVFYHTVQAQENLFRIGLRYNVPWPLIAAANELTAESQISVGDQLIIPFLNSDGTPTESNTTEITPVEGLPPTATPTLEPQTEAEVNLQGTTTYVVQAGDTLYSISRAFGLTPEVVAEANDIVNPEVIFAGITLTIPVPDTGIAPPQQYVVQAGDTMYKIGMELGVSWRLIADANGIPSPYNIEVGQSLVIP